MYYVEVCKVKRHWPFSNERFHLEHDSDDCDDDIDMKIIIQNRKLNEIYVAGRIRI